MTKVPDPASRAVALGYDSIGHLTGITDADGAQNTYTYDL